MKVCLPAKYFFKQSMCERVVPGLCQTPSWALLIRVRWFLIVLCWWADRLWRSGGGVGGGGIGRGRDNFLRGLILRGQFWECTKCEGVEILRHGAGLLWLKETHFSLKLSRQKICFGGSLSTTKCYLYKAWPRNLSAISTTRNVACIYAHMPMHTAEIWKKYIFFYFLKAFLELNWDKYFALYWCFCVTISVILLLIKWSEMDPNVKPQTLVETFDQANYNSIPEYNVALITLLTNFLCQHAQLSVASAVWRDCKLLYEGPWQTRDWALLQFCTNTSTRTLLILMAL